MKQAFILGAGLGTRLRPLTDRLPKPMVPLFHKPLAEWAMRACAAQGIHRFAINTHHLPGAWQDFRPEGMEDITFFHEPALLETGGGLKNISSWIGDDPLLIHNGDIFSTLPLDRLIAGHQASGLPATLALLSNGPSRQIALDPSGARIIDIHEKLGTAASTHFFTGIYCINPEFLDFIPAEEKISVIPTFLELARLGKLGAITLDGGEWIDLGDRESYLLAHRELALDTAIHPTAIIGEGAVIETSTIGPHAVIEAGARIRNSVIWPGAHVSTNADLESCIAFSTHIITGSHSNQDL